MRHVCFAEPGDPIGLLTDQLMIRLRPYFLRRFEQMAQAIDRDTAEQAAGSLIDLAATWSPKSAAYLLGQAMELAALIGGDSAMGNIAPAGFAAEAIGQSFEEQIAFLRQKRPALTQAWTDALHGRHDRDFVVAGLTEGMSRLMLKLG